MKKRRSNGTQIQQKNTPKPIPLAENLGKGHRPDEAPAPIQRSVQEREDALRSTAAIVSVEPMMHSSRLSPAPARKDGAGGQPA